MKKRALSIFIILIISMLSLVSCNVVKDKVYEATGLECYEFKVREDGQTYSLSVKAGATIPEKVKLPTEYNGKPVVEVERGAFKDNETITEVIIPVGYEVIGIEAFAYCKKLSVLNIGQYGGTSDRKTTIKNSAFVGCSVLSTVTLGECVEVINSNAFKDTMVTSVNARGLKSIGKCSFGDCASLKSFYIPATLEYIDEEAFKGSNNVVFTVAESNKVYTAKDGKLARK